MNWTAKRLRTRLKFGGRVLPLPLWLVCAWLLVLALSLAARFVFGFERNALLLQMEEDAGEDSASSDEAIEAPSNNTTIHHSLEASTPTHPHALTNPSPLPQHTTAKLNRISPYLFKVSGFKYCTHLENATFQLHVPLYQFPTMPNGSLPRTLHELDPTEQEFVDFVDAKGEEVNRVLQGVFPSVFVEEQTKRFSCYAAAEGSNANANLTDVRLLQSVDRFSYFNTLLPALAPTRKPNKKPNSPDRSSKAFRHLRSDGSKRRYKLAYLLMVHGDTAQLPGITRLIEELDDGSAVILLHVDGNEHSTALATALESYIAARERTLNDPERIHNFTLAGVPRSAFNPADAAGNVFMARTRYNVTWGHGSIVWMQMNGFFELLDLAHWEYVINMSASDWPMRKSREIHRVLKQPGYKGNSLIQYWPDDFSFSRRLLPHLHIKFPKYNDITVWHMNQIGIMNPPFPRWRFVKHHQWMILARDFAQYLRDSDQVALALAYWEHMLIPDESFFGTVFLNTPRFHNRILNTNKRFLKFSKQPASHPDTLKLKHRKDLGKEERGTDPKHFFMRKVDHTFNETEPLLEWVGKYHIRRHVGDDRSYGMLDGLEFIPGYDALRRVRKIKKLDP